MPVVSKPLSVFQTEVIANEKLVVVVVFEPMSIPPFSVKASQVLEGGLDTHGLQQYQQLDCRVESTKVDCQLCPYPSGLSPCGEWQ